MTDTKPRFERERIARKAALRKDSRLLLFAQPEHYLASRKPHTEYTHVENGIVYDPPIVRAL